MTVAEWVRQALRAARRDEPRRSVESKLEALREASQYNFPAPDIEEMLAEIEKGYVSDPWSPSS